MDCGLLWFYELTELPLKLLFHSLGIFVGFGGYLSAILYKGIS